MLGRSGKLEPMETPKRTHHGRAKRRAALRKELVAWLEKKSEALRETAADKVEVAEHLLGVADQQEATADAVDEVLAEEPKPQEEN